jgi:hypothetical protein
MPVCVRAFLPRRSDPCVTQFLDIVFRLVTGVAAGW